MLTALYSYITVLILEVVDVIPIAASSRVSASGCHSAKRDSRGIALSALALLNRNSPYNLPATRLRAAQLTQSASLGSSQSLTGF